MTIILIKWNLEKFTKSLVLSPAEMIRICRFNFHYFILFNLQGPESFFSGDRSILIDDLVYLVQCLTIYCQVSINAYSNKHINNETNTRDTNDIHEIKIPKAMNDIHTQI